MITKRQFLEVIRDRLSGGPAFADEKDNYPLGLVARFVDMALSTILYNDPLALSQMSIPKEFTAVLGDNGYSVTLDPPPAAGIIAVSYASDDKGDYYVQDKQTAQAFKTVRASNKNAAILFGNALHLNRTPEGQVSVTYVPLVSKMADNDQIIIADGGSEIALYDIIVKAIMMTDRFRADKTNNDLTDPT